MGGHLTDSVRLFAHGTRRFITWH